MSPKDSKDDKDASADAITAVTMRRARAASPVAIAPESWDDEMTPPPQSEPDEIEIAATRIERRARAIESRPGPTPAPESVAAAITIHGVKTELESVKNEVKGQGKKLEEHGLKLVEISTKVGDLVPVLIGELTKDRDVRRKEDHLRVTSTIDVDRHREISAIETDEAKAKAKWQIATKALAIVSTLAAGALALVEASRC